MSAATGEGASPLRTVGPGHSRVTVVGRGKDLIISAGYDVCPAGIEGCVNELPGVAESAVVGVPQPGATVDGLAVVAALKSRIANFKVPKAVFVAPELPRNAMGKVQKNLLRAQHERLFAG